MCNHAEREKFMVTLERNAEGRATVYCDPCLVPLVKGLNDAGFKTVASCCGHGLRNGSIALKDGRCLIITPDLEEHNLIFRQRSNST